MQFPDNDYSAVPSLSRTELCNNATDARCRQGSWPQWRPHFDHLSVIRSIKLSRPRVKCDGTRAKTRFHLSAKLQFSRLLAAEMCASAVVMLDTPRYEVVWRALATHSIRQFPLHFPSRASPCAITFQLDSTTQNRYFSCTLWNNTILHSLSDC